MTNKHTHAVKPEDLISNVLRYGVITCTAFIAFGLLEKLIQEDQTSSNEIVSSIVHGGVLRTFHPPKTLTEFSAGFQRLDPDVLMALGLVLLIALPIVRVGLTVILFFLEKDWTFLCLTLLVFSVLILGIVMGRVL